MCRVSTLLSKPSVQPVLRVIFLKVLTKSLPLFPRMLRNPCTRACSVPGRQAVLQEGGKSPQKTVSLQSLCPGLTVITRHSSSHTQTLNSQKTLMTVGLGTGLCSEGQWWQGVLCPQYCSHWSCSYPELSSQVYSEDKRCWDLIGVTVMSLHVIEHVQQGGGAAPALTHMECL